MERFRRFVRTTPAAFWLALLGIVFSLAVFVARLFQEQSGFALVFMVPGFLTIAILTAVQDPIPRILAAVIAGLMALLFAFLAIGFAVDPGGASPGNAPALVAVHTTAMVIAGAAAVSDFFAFHRARRARSAPSG